jgi:hypothetical protein
MSEMGIKEVTPNNWLEVDYISGRLIRNNRDAQQITVTVSDVYIKSIAPVRLSEKIPLEIRRAFEVAKGAMIYGYFFYPLFTIGLEHLYKVTEIALKTKCKALNPSLKIDTISEEIRFLVKKGILDQKMAERWNALRDLRNNASHPSTQTIVTPPMAILMLKPMATDIEYLFNNDC